MFCQKCGKKIDGNNKFCDGCGTKIEAVNTASSTESINENEVPVYQYQYEKPKGNTGLKIVIIMMSIIILAGLGFGLWYFVIRSDESNSNNTNTNSNANTNENTNTNTNTTPQYIEDDNFAYQLATTERGRLILISKNKTDKVLDVKIEIEFYDKNGTILGSDSDYVFGYAPGQEIVSSFYSAPEKYDSYKIYFDAEDSFYTPRYKDIEIITNDNKETEKIIIQFKNTSDTEIKSVEAGVVFYKNGKIIGYDSDYDTTIKVGRSANLSIRYPYDRYYDTIEFDEYRVFINSAYSY